ncbi:MAG: NUDIX hydrolase [Verrucomicrobia bacterium]|nr:NUDIX hydrolase [Verrucomicrobiota bacterium]
MNEPENAWRVVDSEQRYRSPHLEVVDERVQVPGNEHLTGWTVVRRKRAVVIAPRTESGNFVLIRQARIPVRRFIWEFPAGQVDESLDPDFALIRSTALRELQEEAGYILGHGGRLEDLGQYFTSPGFTNETQRLLLAYPVQPGSSARTAETSETITEVREFSPEELRSMIADSIVQDANSLAMYARLIARGLLSVV